MRGSRIPDAKRIINSVAPLDPADLSEANALNLMFLWDNMGTGDYLEDAAIAGRHLKQLFAREQATPNLTLEVLAGIGWYSQNVYVSFAGGNSPTFAAPISNPRIDVLTLRDDGVLYVIAGAEAASPAVPTIPSTDIPIAQVYNVVGQTTIRDNDEQVAGQGYIQYDLRPFVQVAVGSSAMPKIGIVARYQGTTTVGTNGDSGYVDTVNVTGAGRLRSAHIVNSGSIVNVGYMRVIADGVTILDDSTSVEEDMSPNAAGTQTPSFLLLVGSSSTRVFLDVYYKTSLVIQRRSTAGAGGNSTTVVTAEIEKE